MILNHFRLIPLMAEACSSVTLTEQLEASRQWVITQRVCVCVGRLSHTHYLQFCPSTIRKNAHLVLHIKCSYATRCFLNLPKQKATADTIASLFTASFSIMHTHIRKKALTMIFPHSIPPSLLPAVETRND